MKSPGRWSMRVFFVSPVVLLAIFLGVHLGVATCWSEIHKPCCLTFSHKVIPWNWVNSYEVTKSTCPEKGVIFTTKKGKNICVQPSAKWVQRYISMLKDQKQS